MGNLNCCSSQQQTGDSEKTIQTKNTSDPDIVNDSKNDSDMMSQNKNRKDEKKSEKSRRSKTSSKETDSKGTNKLKSNTPGDHRHNSGETALEPTSEIPSVQPPQGNNKVQNDDSKQDKKPESPSTRNTSARVEVVITQQPTSANLKSNDSSKSQKTVQDNSKVNETRIAESKVLPPEKTTKSDSQHQKPGIINVSSLNDGIELKPNVGIGTKKEETNAGSEFARPANRMKIEKNISTYNKEEEEKRLVQNVLKRKSSQVSFEKNPKRISKDQLDKGDSNNVSHWIHATGVVDQKMIEDTELNRKQENNVNLDQGSPGQDTDSHSLAVTNHSQERVESLPVSDKSQERVESLPVTDQSQERVESLPVTDQSQERVELLPVTDQSQEIVESLPVTDQSQERVESLPVTDQSQERVESLPVTDQSQERVELLPVTDQSQEIVESLPVTDQSQERVESLPVTDQSQERVESLPVTDQSQERVELLPVTDQSQEIVESLPVTDQSQEIVESLPVTDQSQEIVESLPVTDQSQEIVESLPVTDQSQERVESLPVTDQSQESDESKEVEPMEEGEADEYQDCHEGNVDGFQERSNEPNHEISSKHSTEFKSPVYNRVGNNDDASCPIDDANDLGHSSVEQMGETTHGNEELFHKRNPVGLQNLGNTCFFNSVMQNLLQTRALEGALIRMDTLDSPPAPSEPKKRRNKNPKVHTSSSKPLTAALVDFYEKPSPTNVFNQICNKSPRFSGGHQQDSHELLRHLMDGLRNEEKMSSGDNPQKILTLVDQVFGGHYMTVYTCHVCTLPYHLCEPMLDISLPVTFSSDKSSYNEHQQSSESKVDPGLEEREKEDYKKAIKTMMSRYGTLDRYEAGSVEDCLRFFTRKELLDEYLCMACYKKRQERGETELVMTEATKQTLVYNPPAILTLHLKRFEQTARGFKKANNEISFEEMLDLGPFCSLWSKRVQRNQKNIWYSLYGVVVHHGSLLGGHYVAYVKARNCDIASLRGFQQEQFLDRDGITEETLVEEMRKWSRSRDRSEYRPSAIEGDWYYVSDSHVTKSRWEEVQDQQAYLLFYERLKNTKETTEAKRRKIHEDGTAV